MMTKRKIDKARGERIRYVRSEILKIGSQEQFAKLLSQHGPAVTRGAVGNWETGKEVGIENLSRICKLAKVDLNWLAYNRGNPDAPIISSFDPDSLEEEQPEVGYSREHWQGSQEGAIPEIDGKLGAGQGQLGEVINLPVGNNAISGHAVKAEWILPIEYLRNEAKASPSRTIVMEVVGDSMSPTYLPGDRVLVDLSQDTMTSDTVYAISDGETEPQIKRLQRVPFSAPAEVIIISDNENLQDFTVELDRLKILGRICGVISRR
ncbi:LexA family transcriptional regulator [Martelella mediterranea]|uniref:Phage repressor protein C with HTH and peptisase S24 domain n=1 Tax=Martelella mediterranea TaxID=293089 RepID=A0A4R3NIX5_9HYPH|nr:LexA family transcriptional regulator [Martelella mediterranea]TCT34681.1 phage repressor protein C with HTH and peptisase S24 domain [Martelella mediterranea]